MIDRIEEKEIDQIFIQSVNPDDVNGPSSPNQQTKKKREALERKISQQRIHEHELK